MDHCSLTCTSASEVRETPVAGIAMPPPCPRCGGLTRGTGVGYCVDKACRLEAQEARRPARSGRKPDPSRERQARREKERLRAELGPAPRGPQQDSGSAREARRLKEQLREEFGPARRGPQQDPRSLREARRQQAKPRDEVGPARRGPQQDPSSLREARRQNEQLRDELGPTPRGPRSRAWQSEESS